MKDPDDVTAYQKSIERLRVHIFLARLDGDFEQVRGEILRKEPVPGDDAVEKGSVLVTTKNVCAKVDHLRTSSQKSISTANGNEASIIGKGSLSLTNTLNLDSVLVVLSLDYNL
ncbi:hypothetical protein ACH5RR_001224 [Cinchona calisaya]|uniref:Uncharacterized protein n=1 Tax=Cinchona calisaya TaxID=153742 RepID=A0ABD3B3L7_9GENT